MTVERLRALVRPDSVALVGASDTPGKLTARPLTFLRQHGFAGRIYPVNPMRETVQGLQAYPTVAAIPEPVDHAYVLVGTAQVRAAVQDCARAGVKVVSVLADGFAEAGPAGQALQSELVAIAQAADMLLIGPNSTGVVDTRHGFGCTTNAAFRADTLPAGRIAAISQSGSLIGTLLSRGTARGVRFSTFVSVGNEAAAGVGTLGQVLLQDPGIDGFVLFMETIRDAPELAAFSRAAHVQGKPVVAYMLGKSDEGQALAVSHTGALTGGKEAVDAFLASAGIAQVTQFDALLEAPAALALRARMAERPGHVTVLTTTGGGGAMVVDQLSLRGVPIAGCSAASRAVLTAQDIALGHGKLVDVTLAGTNYVTMKTVVSQLVQDPATGLLVVAIGSSAQFNPELSVTPIIDAVAEASEGAAPVMAFPLPHAEAALGMLEAAGIPSFRTVESCADAVGLLLGTSPPRAETAAELPAPADRLLEAAPAGIMNEVTAGAVFDALGIAGPAQVVLPPGAPVAAPGLAFPVVAKLVSDDIPHKTEAGAITIGIPDLDALETAIAQMRTHVGAQNARIDGVLVQEMRKGPGEALIGLTRDPLVGPVVTLAAGGTLAEVYRDATVEPAPVDLATARDMVARIKGFAPLRGYRGHPEGDLEALAHALAALSHLAAHVDVAEAEINPVLIGPKGRGVTRLDALIRKT